MFRSRPHSLRPALAVSVPVLTFLLSILSCSHSTTPSLTPHRESAIAVRTTPAALVVETTAAHFRLLPSGYLQASLLRGGQEWTLDDPAANTSTDFAVIAGKETNEFVLDLDHAKVSAASGRLGGKGKRIEVSGNSSSSPTLEKHVIVEFYDDFPNIALTTVSYKNLGSAEILLDRVVMQQHVLNASLQDSTVPPYAMWSFHGSSEAWGKDDVMQIGPKFTRANPMQTMMHNDENQTGGGIPVVAFWTRSVGEAIGHAEAIPLQLSLPVRTLPSGQVHASITLDTKSRLQPGEVYTTPLTFVVVFHGDFSTIEHLLEDAAGPRIESRPSDRRRLPGELVWLGIRDGFHAQANAGNHSEAATTRLTLGDAGCRLVQIPGRLGASDRYVPRRFSPESREGISRGGNPPHALVDTSGG